MGINRAWIAAAVAVAAPAAALCWLQYRSLSVLEEKTQAAVRDSLRGQLELVRAELEARVRQVAGDALTPLAGRHNLGCEESSPGQAFLISQGICQGAKAQEAADGFRVAHPVGPFRVFQSAAACASCHAAEWARDHHSLVYVYRVLPDDSVAGIRIPMDYVASTLLPEAVAAVKSRGSDQDWTAALTGAGGDGEVTVAAGPMLPLLSISGSYQGATVYSLARTQTRQWAWLWGGALVSLLVGVGLLMRAAAKESRVAEMKAAFVSNVSHEMKTPLAMIRVYAETLELGRVADPERMREYFRVIHKETVRLTHMIDNVLDLARLESGQGEFRFAEISVGRLVEDTVRGYEEQIHGAGYALSLEIESPAPGAVADERALSGVVLNLLSNAVKYGGQEKRIDVRVFNEDGQACVSVSDRGIGIPPAEQQRIFEKFYRVDSTLVHENKGTGLGLALAKQVMEAHGGSIQVESRLGQGATFTIRLPAVEWAGEETGEIAEASHR